MGSFIDLLLWVCSIIGNLESFWIQFCFWVWKFGAWFELGLSKNYRDCVIWLVSCEIFCWIIEIWGFETWRWLVMDCKHTRCAGCFNGLKLLFFYELQPLSCWMYTDLLVLRCWCRMDSIWTGCSCSHGLPISWGCKGINCFIFSVVFFLYVLF